MERAGVSWGNVRAFGRTLRLHAFRRIAVEQRHHRVVGIDTVRIKVDHEAFLKPPTGQARRLAGERFA